MENVLGAYSRPRRILSRRQMKNVMLRLGRFLLILTNQEGKLEQATTTDTRLPAEDVHVITGHRNWKIAEEKKTSELTLIVKNLITYQQVGGFSPV